jgi:hypothetical protein
MLGACDLCKKLLRLLSKGNLGQFCRLILIFFRPSRYPFTISNLWRACRLVIASMLILLPAGFVGLIADQLVDREYAFDGKVLGRRKYTVLRRVFFGLGHAPTDRSTIQS